jgi:hypothetical protein
MTKTQASRIWQSAAQYVLGCIGLASLTFACFSLGLNLATAGFLYLITIRAAALLT